MTDNQRDFPIKVGLHASARLEVKTEIPSETTGSVIGALLDIIRPFTERRGLRADQIRLQREEVALEIVKKAAIRAEIDKAQLSPAPTKFIVPFLEKASLEGDSNEMQERWASLLLAASKSFQSAHLTFIDILSRLSADELGLLEAVCFDYAAFPETSYPSGHVVENARRVANELPRLVVTSPDHNWTGAQAAYVEFSNFCRLSYGALLHTSVWNGAGFFFYGDPRFKEYLKTPPFGAVGILERERLLETKEIVGNMAATGMHWIPSGIPTVGYFNLTYLAIKFVQDCSPHASEMTARSPASVSAKL